MSKQMTTEQLAGVGDVIRRVMDHVAWQAARLSQMEDALDEIISIGVSPAARDNGPNYIANRMYHIADKARQPDQGGGQHE